MITKQAAGSGERVRVTFELPSTPWADRVNLVGEFNDWDTTITPMTRQGATGPWRVTVELQAGLRYAFRYLVDGKEWRSDWHADDYQENPYGSRDSVVDLLEGHRSHCQGAQSSDCGPGQRLVTIGERDEE